MEKQEQPTFKHPQQQSNQPAYGQVFSPIPDTTTLTNELADLRQQIEELRNKRINWNTDVIGLFETVSVAPTLQPTSPYEQVKIYVNGATLRLYWYDATGQVWHFVTATA